MPISEAQLDTWSHQGSITQSKETYAAIREALDDTTAGYGQKEYSIFLQGSYGNDTNIWADSDVDVVIKLESTYAYDLEDLPENEKSLFKAGTEQATYPYTVFKKDIVAQLHRKFPGFVTPGKKAIKVNGDGRRRDADVVAAIEHRRYIQFLDFRNENYVEGISFGQQMEQKLLTTRSSIPIIVRGSIKQLIIGLSPWFESSRTCAKS